MGKGIYDVIVVGSGPSGLNTARILSSQGYNVVILEKKTNIGEGIVCTGIVGTELKEYLALPDEIVLHEIRKIKLVSPFGSSISYSFPKPIAYVLDRRGFDCALLDYAIRCGAEVRFGYRVREIKIKDEYVDVIAQSVLDRGLNQIKAKMVILATGAQTELAKRIGLGYPSSFLKAAQKVCQLDHDGSVQIFTGSLVSQGAFGWMVPIGECSVKLGVMSEDDPRKRLLYLSKKVSVGDSSRPFFKRIPQGLVYGTFKERALSVGGCAGQVKTTTGGGIYFGLVCSQIAAEVASLALKKGAFGEEILSEYERRWHEKLKREIERGMSLRKIWKRMNDPTIERLFGLLNSFGLLDLVASKANFDWHVSALYDLIQNKALRALVGKVVSDSG